MTDEMNRDRGPVDEIAQVPGRGQDLQFIREYRQRCPAGRLHLRMIAVEAISALGALVAMLYLVIG